MDALWLWTKREHFKVIPNPFKDLHSLNAGKRKTGKEKRATLHFAEGQIKSNQSDLVWQKRLISQLVRCRWSNSLFGTVFAMGRLLIGGDLLETPVRSHKRGK